MSLIAGVCLLFVRQPGAFAWVIIISLIAAGFCPLFAILTLLRITRTEISLFDLIAAAVIPLVIVVLYNATLKLSIHEVLGRDLSRVATRLLWLDVLGWVLGLITLARFVSRLPERK